MTCENPYATGTGNAQAEIEVAVPNDGPTDDQVMGERIVPPLFFRRGVPPPTRCARGAAAGDDRITTTDEVIGLREIFVRPGSISLIVVIPTP